LIVVIVLIGGAGYFALFRERQPLAKQKATSQAGEIEEIRSLLKEKTWVPVIVILEGKDYTASESRDETPKETEIQKIQDIVLATLKDDDFRLGKRFRFLPAFAGEISATGLEKLLKNPQVKSIAIDKPDKTSLWEGF
jgi:hypothetical protein